MKMIICWLILLALALPMIPAQAAETPDTLQVFDGDEGVINGLAVHDGLIMTTSDMQNYAVIDPEDDWFFRAEKLPSSMTDIEDAAMVSNSGVIPGDDGLYMIMYAMYIEDEDFSTAEVRAVLHSLEPVGNGRIKSAALCELDWATVQDAAGRAAIDGGLEHPVIAGGMLVGGIGSYVAIFDIEGGDCELISTYAAPVCGYRDGCVLTQESAYEAPDAPVIVCAYDPQRDRAEDLLTIMSSNYMTVSAAAYHPESDSLFYACNGEVVKVTGMDPETMVSIGAVSGSFRYAEFMAALDENTCIYASEYVLTVLDAGSPVEGRQFSVYTRNYTAYEEPNSAKQGFRSMFPDAVRRDVDSIGSIGDEILTRSSAIDVFVIDAADPDYQTLLTRGMLMDLSDSAAIKTLVESAYPGIQQAVMNGGSICAVPLYADCEFPYSYSPAAMAELGLKEDDMPRTWLEFMQLLQVLPEMLAENGVITAFKLGYDIEGARQDMLTYLYRDYMTWLYATGQDITFDTPLMRELLAEFEKIDFDALGLYEEREYLSQEPDEYLFKCYARVSPESAVMLESSRLPLPLAVEAASEPVMNTVLQLAFINPYSENQEMALAYLELLAGNLPTATHYALSDAYTEPIRSSEYEYWHELYIQRIAEIETELEKSEEPERTEWEKTLKIWQTQFDELENGDTARGWLMNETSISMYRDFAAYMAVDENCGLRRDATNVITDLFMQYLGGSLTSEETLATIDERIHMMLLEAQ